MRAIVCSVDMDMGKRGVNGEKREWTVSVVHENQDNGRTGIQKDTGCLIESGQKH